MYKNKTFLGVIPARGGSKGIPQKNIIKVKGRPLIDFTIKEALKSLYLDKVIVSTDSLEIAKISMDCGAEIPFLRPKELAGDKNKIIETLIHLIQELANRNATYDYIVLLQPTQPLRKSFHIDEAIKLAIDFNYNSLVGVSKVKEHPILMRTIDKNNQLDNLINVNSTLRRQDFPEYFKVNGIIYINRIDKDFNLNTSLNDNKYPFIIENKYDLDIDEPFDLELLKLRLKLNQ